MAPIWGLFGLEFLGFYFLHINLPRFLGGVAGTVASGGVVGVDLSFLGCAGALNILFLAPFGLPHLLGTVALGGVDGIVASGGVAGVDLSFLGCAGALNILFFAPLGLPHLPGIVALGGVAGCGGMYGFFQ